MNTYKTALLLAGMCVVFSARTGTAALVYQGQLAEGTNPPSGTYDFCFTLYDAATDGSVVAGPLTNAGVAVVDGAFTTTLDFGGQAFTGADRWLELRCVRTVRARLRC